MKIDLSQEYKDNLYEKVLEKKKQRTKTRKVLLNTFLVFVSVVGIASYGFSKLSKGDYNNFFISKTENIEFNDDYEYFDDLGIKLEFINKDENSLTIGINIKYENIKDYEVDVKDLNIFNLDNDEYVVKNEYTKDMKKYIITKNKKYKDNSEIIYILRYDFENICKLENIKINIKKIYISNEYSENEYEFVFEKEISIE